LSYLGNESDLFSSSSSSSSYVSFFFCYPPARIEVGRLEGVGMAKSCAAGGGDFRLTGIAGAVLFTAVFFVALYGFGRVAYVEGDASCNRLCNLPFLPFARQQNGGADPREVSLRLIPTSKQAYFILIALMCALDLPRYCVMALENEYMCSARTWTYSLHMLANAVFFCSYSIICSLWQNSIGSSSKMALFQTPVLLRLNGSFLLLCIAGFVLCLRAKNIFDFFKTVFYTVYTVVDAGKNLFFFSVISWSGYMIIKPLWDHRARVDSIDETTEHRFKSILVKLELLLLACFISSTLRFGMLIYKVTILDASVRGSWYTGPVWWLLSDFIPRLLPSVGFMVIMFGSVLVGKSGQHHLLEVEDVYEDEHEDVKNLCDP